ncbi:MAG TPA: SSI family serine proteinase inhibitor [Gaiellaceae bacterium]
MNVLAAILIASTSLHITVWPDGEGHTPKRAYTLRCAPVGGTLPHRAAACRKLAALKTPFAPTPKDRACTQIYGGPEEALVSGRFRGHSVRARFSREDGCEIARWNRVRFLFPG